MELEKEYYKLCLRHMKQNDNVFMFWGANNSGYTKCIENAGLYEQCEYDFEKQVNQGDILVHKNIVDKLAQKVRLPIYGEKVETYAGLNEFLVLPNTGQVRKELGITILDIKHSGSDNSFDAYFTNTVKEKLKQVLSETHFNVKGKEEYFTEYWYCDSIVEADTRSDAIFKVFTSGEFGLTSVDCSYIEFKKKVVCSRVKHTVFVKWENIPELKMPYE